MARELVDNALDAGARQLTYRFVDVDPLVADFLRYVEAIGPRRPKARRIGC